MSPNGHHVVEPLRVGPMARKHALTEWLAFDLPNRVPDAGPFKAKLEAADACE